MFGLIKNNIKTKIGIVLPASYPASRVSLSGGGNVQDALDDETYNMQGTYNNVAYTINFNRHGKTVSFYASLDGMNTGDSYVVFGQLPSNFKPKTTYAVFAPYSNSAPYAFLGNGSLWITGGGGQVGLYKNSSYPQKSYIFGTYITA